MNGYSEILCELNNKNELGDTLRVTNPRTVGESVNGETQARAISVLM